jgi:hypothetical protein
MPERHSEYLRSPDDFYVEPAWVAHLLFDAVEFRNIHDPCCGLGTIVDAALAAGIAATGADLVDRAQGRFGVQDFLSDSTPRSNVVTNPPFLASVGVVRHALEVVPDGGRVAAIAPITWLSSQGRYEMFADAQTEQVIMLSRRPSMPPGALLIEQGESCRHSGSIDFAWVVWRKGRRGSPATITWTK